MQTRDWGLWIELEFKKQVFTFLAVIPSVCLGWVVVPPPFIFLVPYLYSIYKVSTTFLQQNKVNKDMQ